MDNKKQIMTLIGGINDPAFLFIVRQVCAGALLSQNQVNTYPSNPAERNKAWEKLAERLIHISTMMEDGKYKNNLDKAENW
jgi:hypothetical protein